MRKEDKKESRSFIIKIVLIISTVLLLMLPIEASYNGNIDVGVNGDLEGLLAIEEIRIDSAKASITGGLQEHVVVKGPLIFFILFDVKIGKEDYAATKDVADELGGGLYGEGTPGMFDTSEVKQ